MLLDRDIEWIYQKMKGISDASTEIGQPNNKKWATTVAKILDFKPAIYNPQ